MVWLFVSGCALIEGESTAVPAADPEVAVSSTATTMQPEGTVPTVPTVTSVSTGTPITDSRNTLIVWITPEIAANNSPGGLLLQEQIAAYQREHPELNIIVQQKAVTGQGAILNYLRTGRNIAPDILPDRIAIPANQMDTAFMENLIFPLDGLIATETIEDLYPAGIDLVIQENRLRGYPFIFTNMQHLVYNSTTYTSTIPGSWSEFVAATNEKRFVFPANGSAGVNLTLELYLANEGSLVNEADIPTLELEPLRSTLQGFIIGRNNGIILSQSSNISSLQESWQLYANGTANISLTSGEIFLQNRSETGNSGYAPVPGVNGSLTPFVSGWVWAISTADATEQQLAADLLNFLIEPQNLGAWSYTSGYLPTRRGAYAFWPETDQYGLFVQSQLALAEKNPLNNSDIINTALKNALFDVVSLTQTAQLAAEEAINTVQP